MKFLLPFVGLVCYIVGLYLYLIKNDEHGKKSCLLMLLGFFLIIANWFYFWYSINDKMGKSGFTSIIIIATLFTIIFMSILLIHYHDEFQVGFGSFFLICLIFFATYFGNKLPLVTLDNSVIEMSGKYGGEFKVSAIQSVDTVSIFPRELRRRDGKNGPIVHYGNFDMQYEKKMAKLCFYKNNPPTSK